MKKPYLIFISFFMIFLLISSGCKKKKEEAKVETQAKPQKTQNPFQSNRQGQNPFLGNSNQKPVQTEKGENMLVGNTVNSNPFTGNAIVNPFQPKDPFQRAFEDNKNPFR